MRRRFIRYLLWLSLLPASAHAGNLVLEADLSTEEQTLIKKTFVEPYNQETENRTAGQAPSRQCFSPKNHPNVNIPYPPLAALKQSEKSVCLIIRQTVSAF